MKKIFLLLLISITTIFSQTKNELLGFWLLNSNTELLKITKDSITFNSGFFIDGTINTAKKEISFMNTILNYEMFNNKMVLNFNEGNDKTFLNVDVGLPLSDTLSQIKTADLVNKSKIWVSNNVEKQLLLIILNDTTVKIGGILKSTTSSYSIIYDVIIIKDFGAKKINYQIEGNVLNLIPEGSKEKYIYNKL